MTIRPFLKRAVATASVALLVLGLARAAFAQQAADKQYRIRSKTEAFVKSQTLADDPGDDDLRRLHRARLNAALDEVFGRTLDFNRDGSEVDRLLDSGLRLLEAELEFHERLEDRARALQGHLEISRELTAIIEARTKAEPDTGARLGYARYCQSSIELALMKARTGKPQDGLSGDDPDPQ
jgi:hypothetical protein